MVISCTPAWLLIYINDMLSAGLNIEGMKELKEMKTSFDMKDIYKIVWLLTLIFTFLQKHEIVKGKDQRTQEGLILDLCLLD